MASEVLGRIKANKRDKSPIKFKDHKGEVREDRYAPIATVFANKFGGGDVVPEKNADPQLIAAVFAPGQREYYVSYFPVKDDGPRDDDF